MKFGEYLRKHLNPQWASQYISYDDMKEVLDDIVNNAPARDDNDQTSLRQHYFTEADDDFFEVSHSM
jgi:SPX domain protein involved in polyphosphate accumulation